MLVKSAPFCVTDKVLTILSPPATCVKVIVPVLELVVSFLVTVTETVAFPVPELVLIVIQALFAITVKLTFELKLTSHFGLVYFFKHLG